MGVWLFAHLECLIIALVCASTRSTAHGNASDSGASLDLHLAPSDKYSPPLYSPPFDWCTCVVPSSWHVELPYPRARLPIVSHRIFARTHQSYTKVIWEAPKRAGSRCNARLKRRAHLISQPHVDVTSKVQYALTTASCPTSCTSCTTEQPLLCFRRR